MASVIVNDGTWILYKGIRAKEDYFYLQRLISRIQSLRDTLKDKLLADAIEELNREVRRLHGKLKRRLLHLQEFCEAPNRTTPRTRCFNHLPRLPIQYRSAEGQ